MAKMRQRISGFDLAGADAIFALFIINFNICFGSLLLAFGQYVVPCR
jgi:hypothetical protein